MVLKFLQQIYVHCDFLIQEKDTVHMDLISFLFLNLEAGTFVLCVVLIGSRTTDLFFICFYLKLCLELGDVLLTRLIW